MPFQKRSFKPQGGNSDYFRVTGMFHMTTKTGKKGWSGSPDRETAERFYERLGDILESGQVPRFTVWDNGSKPGALTCGAADDTPKKGSSYKGGYKPYPKKEERIMDEPMEEVSDGYTVE